jgi:hypothetical protein
MFYRCGVCGERFGSEAGIQEHISKPDKDGESHDGEPWSVCDDEIAIVARVSSESPWCYFGSWRFGRDAAFSEDEAVGWQIRQLFRMGFVDVRVKHVADAKHLFEAQAEDTQ